MFRSRSTRPILGVLVLVVVATFGPLGAGQFTTNAYCPVGDGGTEQPPGSTEKLHLDLAPVDVRMRLTPTGGTQPVPANVTGIHHVFDAPGTLSVTVEVANIGTRDAETGSATKVRVTVQRADGAADSRTATMAAPILGVNETATLTFAVQAGGHTVRVEVNPDKDPAERCTDNAPNSACPDGAGLPTACIETYYGNNIRTHGLLVAALPDLMVRGISTDGPARATTGPSPDSNARITVELQNVGSTTAFNHSRLSPVDAPFQARLEIPGCACLPTLLTFPAVPPGESRSASTTLSLRGLRSAFDVHVFIDPFDRVADADPDNDAGTETFPLPTAELFPTVDIDLPHNGDAYLLRTGSPLSFGVTVTNSGDAPARTSTGSAFRVVVQRSTESLYRHDAHYGLDPDATANFTLTEDTADLFGTVTYTVRVDPGDDVAERNEGNNAWVFQVTLAEYGASIDIGTHADATTVPPGVTAKVPFTLRNTGTVRDTFVFPEASADTTVRYADTQGRTVQTVTIAAGEVFKGQFEKAIPGGLAVGDHVTAQIRATSQNASVTAARNVTFTVGEDTVAPALSLEDPSTGFLRSNQVVLRIVDNVNVTLAEADMAGAYTPIEPDEPGGSLYTVDVTGRPSSFRLNVRARDAAGNLAARSFDLVRDATPPRVTKVEFTPSQGVLPGDLVNIVVRAEDANMDRVVAALYQPRPGGAYQQLVPIPRQGDNYVLRDWKVPDRPGHYVFNVTAYDKSGLTGSYYTRLTVQGLDIRLAADVPQASPRNPVEGQRVILRYMLQNTSPTHETGNFTVSLTLDFGKGRAQGVGVPSLKPGELRPLDFPWTATAGPHTFSFTIDTANQVAEDNEPDLFDPNNKPGNNLRHVTTEQIFGKDYPLFLDNETSTFAGFLNRVTQHWYVAPLALVVAGLFAVAFVLGRKTGGP